MRQKHRDLGDLGQFAAKLLEDALEYRHQEGDQRHHHAHGEDDHEGRVDHRRADLPAQGGVLLELVGDPHECVLQDAPGLAGLRHGDEQRTKDLRVAGHRLAQGKARLDVLANRDDGFLQELALGLLLEYVQGAQDAHPGGDHGRQLAREDGELGRLDRLQEAELDLARAVLVGDIENDQSAPLELVGDGLLGLGFELPARLDAGEVDRLEDVRAHPLRP